MEYLEYIDVFQADDRVLITEYEPLTLKNGWIDPNQRLPEPETPVLALVHGLDYPIVLELRWETCNEMIESYFKGFLYWDNPHDDGQDYGDRVFAWQSLPLDP